MQVVNSAWSALPKFIWLGCFQTASSLYFLYEERMAMRQILKSREPNFSFPSQRVSFDDVRRTLSSAEEVENSVWKRSRPADHAKRLLTL